MPAVKETVVWLLPEVVAQMLNKTPASLAQWRHYGRGPKYHKIGRKVMYKQSDVELFMENSVVDPADTN